MGTGKRADAALDRLGVAVDRLGIGQAHDRLSDSQDIAGAMVDFAREQHLVFFRLPALGDVDRDAAEPREPAGAVAMAGSDTDAPANLAVRTADAEFGPDRLLALGDRGERRFQPRQVVRMDEAPQPGNAEVDRARCDAEDAVLTFIEGATAVAAIPVPGPHLAGGERQAAELLGLQQTRVGGFELGGPRRDAPFQLAVERLELARFPVKFGEHPDLGPEHRRDHRHRHIIDRAHLVAAQRVDLAQMHRRDENDRGFLEARVLAHHLGELEAVELGHADVDEHDGDLSFQEMLQRLAPGGCLDQVLVEIAQDHLVAEEFRRLVVDEEDVDFVVVHLIAPPSSSDAATF